MNIINISVPAGVVSPICACEPVMVGYVGESGVTRVDLDFSAWADAYGEGSISLGLKRRTDSVWYPVSLVVDGSTASWTVSDIDTGVYGIGEARYTYEVESGNKRSAVFRFFVDHGLLQEGPVPDPYEDIVEHIEELAAQTEENAADAEAARQAIEDMGATAHALPAGSKPSVDKLVDPETGAVTLDFGIPGGGGGSGGTFVYEQTSAAAVWTIAHNLGKYPSVTIVDSGGSSVVGEIVYIDDNTVRCTFGGAFSGTAYLN